MTVESNYVIAIATLNDWLKRLAPVFQPLRSIKEARKGFFGCYSVCETMKDTKEGYFIVKANYKYLCNSIVG